MSNRTKNNQSRSSTDHVAIAINWLSRAPLYFCHFFFVMATALVPVYFGYIAMSSLIGIEPGIQMIAPFLSPDPTSGEILLFSIIATVCLAPLCIGFAMVFSDAKKRLNKPPRFYKDNISEF